MEPRKRIITEHEAGQRLDRFLRKHFTEFPLSGLYKLLRTKKIKVNGKKADAEQMLSSGDSIEFWLPEERIVKEQPKKEFDSAGIVKTPLFKTHFKILFEDDALLILEKPGDIAVHPGSNHRTGRTLLDLAQGYIAHSAPKNPVPQLVHRLDLQTSGVIVLAKTPEVLRKMNAQFREKETKKEYLALVRGKLSSDGGTIKLKLLRTEGRSKSTKIVVAHREGSKSATTHFQVVERFGNEATLVRIELETGRMHQIRVHFQTIGHPLCGDEAYGDFVFNREFAKAYGLKRHFLHAERLTFTHPLTGKKETIVSPLSDELNGVLTRLRGKK